MNSRAALGGGGTNSGCAGNDVLRLRKAVWLEAARWRRGVQTALKSAGLTFSQWLVLEATHELIEETRDAVSQSDVARHLEFDRMTVSLAMQSLANRGFVDRDAGPSWPVLRVWVTDTGKSALVKARARVSQVPFGSPQSP